MNELYIMTKRLQTVENGVNVDMINDNIKGYYTEKSKD